MPPTLRVAASALAIVATAAGAASARADVPDLWHVGVDLRTELGSHPLRLGGGVQRGPWDLTLVLDPMVVTDDQHDLDLLLERRLGGSAWAALAGLRWTSIGIAGGRQSQDRALIGLSAPLAGGDGSRLQIRWAIEAAAVVVRHGAGLPTAWISFSSDRDFVDLLDLGMFVRVDYASLL